MRVFLSHHAQSSDWTYSHGSVLFPTWHRPYIMLIEASTLVTLYLRMLTFLQQVIGTEATALAQQLDALESNPNSTKWQEAAKKLRFPYVVSYLCTFLKDAQTIMHIRYWDWADPKVEKEGMPSILYEEEISLKISHMGVVKVPNPLALFPINDIPPDFTDYVDDEVQLLILSDIDIS